MGESHMPADNATVARLHALREGGIAAVDPVRFAYLNALARRAAEQPGLLRQRLNEKIAHETEQLEKQCRKKHHAKAKTEAAATSSPLAELLTYLASHGETSSAAEQPTNVAKPVSPLGGATHAASPRELKSIAYFRESWAQLHTEQQLTQTLAQAPENAGPMNSQHLALRALKLMRDHAPAYLQGFMSYVDALIWLEHAAPIKATDRGRVKGKKSAS